MFTCCRGCGVPQSDELVPGVAEAGMWSSRRLDLRLQELAIDPAGQARGSEFKQRVRGLASHLHRVDIREEILLLDTHAKPERARFGAAKEVQLFRNGESSENEAAAPCGAKIKFHELGAIPRAKRSATISSALWG